MKKEEIKKLSIAELEKKESSLKLSTGFLTGILMVLFIVVLYGMIEDKKFDVMLIVPIALSTICVRNYGILRNIQSELLNKKS